jgi:hypothetical protein
MVHHGASIRTAVTLDEDVECLVREALSQSRSNFQESIAAAIRPGLGHKNAHTLQALEPRLLTPIWH